MEENTLEMTYMVNNEIDDKLNIIVTAESTNGIDKIITPDGNEINIIDKKKVAIDYKINKNQEYIFKVKLKGQTELKDYILIENDTAYPIIEQNESYAYPELNEYGVTINKKVDIDFGSDNNNFYSIDNGETWEEYTGTIKIKNPCELRAKHKVDGNIIQKVNVKNIEINLAGDALETYAYDEDEDTYAEVQKYQTKKLYVDSTMQGRILYIVFSAHNDSFYYPSIGFYSSEGEELEGESYSSGDRTLQLEIPIGTDYIAFSAPGSFGYTTYMSIYEIKALNTPEIAVTNYYPKLTEYGVEKPTNGVTITYHNTSVQKLYKIDEEDWKTYNDEEIVLEIGKTIYAKGIDKNGKETIEIAQYTSEVMSDALGLEAYDENEDTYAEVGNYETKKIYVDSTMQGKNLYIVFYAYNDSWQRPCIGFYSSEGEELEGESYSSGDRTLQFEIPIGTDYIAFYVPGASYYHAHMEIYEIRK